MDKFNQLFNEIMETVKFSDPLGRKLYVINDDAFFPIIYELNDKKCLIVASDLNEDSLHILNRLKTRSHKLYSFDDLIEMIKLGINKFFEYKYEELFTEFRRKHHLKIKSLYDKNDCSCSIISKERFKEIKVCINMVFNLGKNPIETYSNEIQNMASKCDYFCFINTILDKNMKIYNSDKQLQIELIKIDKKLNII